MDNVPYGIMLKWPLWKLAEEIGYLSGGQQGMYDLGNRPYNPDIQPGDPPVFPQPGHSMSGDTELDPSMLLQTIPLMHARELVFRDPFMTYRQKGQAGAIFNNAGYNTATGKTSMSDLAAGAIKVTGSLGTGVLAGYVLGKLFSLPDPVTRALSITGGIANTLISTGVVAP
jgi:hypothetical protein